MPDYIRLHAVAYCTTVKVRSVCSFYNKHNIHDLQKKKKINNDVKKREQKLVDFIDIGKSPFF